MRSRDFQDGYDQALAETAGAVQAMDLKLRDIERTLWAVVAASGGSVAVPRALMATMYKPEWEIRRDDATDCIVYSVAGMKRAG